MTETSQSPNFQSSETTISELFKRNPSTLTEDELKKIVAYYREKRLQSMMAKPIAAAPKKTTIDIDL